MRIARIPAADRDRLCKANAILAARIETALPSLSVARRSAEQFTDMLRNVREEALEAWLDEAEEELLGAFARGRLRQDRAAVAATLRELWSNGQSEY